MTAVTTTKAQAQEALEALEIRLADPKPGKVQVLTAADMAALRNLVATALRYVGEAK